MVASGSCTDAQARRQEFEAKTVKLRGLAAGLGLDAILLKRVENFAWITAGGTNLVEANREAGVAAILVTPSGTEALTANNEHARITDEEVGPLGIPVVSHKWYGSFTDLVSARTQGMRLGSDLPGVGRDIGGELAVLRARLTRWEVARYRQIGRDAAAAVERCAWAVRPAMTEHAVAASLEAAEREAGLVPTVTLIAAEERVARYRHPVPTGKRVDHYCLITTCAHRGGLTVALTRLVHFGAPPADLLRRWEAVAKVDAAMILATVPGRPARDVLTRAAELYAASGFPGEWELHHQGGAIAYANREYVVTPDCDRVIQSGQAYAWNPTIAGVKSEDTILIPEDGTGHEVLTAASERWPKVRVDLPEGSVERPAMLVVG